MTNDKLDLILEKLYSIDKKVGSDEIRTIFTESVVNEINRRLGVHKEEIIGEIAELRDSVDRLAKTIRRKR